MQIKNAFFITSAANVEGFYKTEKPIICVSGRSNVGKSSLINMLANQRKLAKTSDTPGRTRLVNYFDFGDFVLADLPGYGYAKVSKQEKIKWADTLEKFFELSNIKYCFALVDVRHEPTKDDVTMVNYLYAKRLSFSVVATKGDKLSRAQIQKQKAIIARELKMGESDIIVTSYNGLGKETLLLKIENIINLSKQLDW